MADPQVGIDQGIFHECFDLVDIDLALLIFFNKLHCHFDMADTALAQNVIFIETDLFRLIHIPLDGCHSFRWQVQRGIISDRLFGDQHAAGVDRALVGHVGHSFMNGHDLSESALFLVEWPPGSGR
jgi:hypothetical protein